jgi:glutathione S-transferase
VHHLIGITFSHYVEKARWALDRYGVEYRESRYLPLMHLPAAAWASHGRGSADRASSRFSTPILITEDGRRICDSSEIVRYASDRWGEGELYANDAARELEQRFHDGLARDTRRVGYFFSLGDKGAMRALFSNVGSSQRALARLATPVSNFILRRQLGATEERAERAIGRIRDELDEVSERIADGRRYLLGDEFTAADIAFACAMAPVMLVQPDEGLGAQLPTPEELPPRVRELRASMRATPAARLALRLFREERGPR